MRELIGNGLSLSSSNSRSLAPCLNRIELSLSLKRREPSASCCRGTRVARGYQASHNHFPNIAGGCRHVEMLLEHGANLRKDRTEDGSTAAYFAARSGSFEVIKYERNDSLLEGPATLARRQLSFDKS